MAFVENPTERAIDKDTGGIVLVTGTPNVDPDFSTPQTSHFFSRRTTKVKIERYPSDVFRPAYSVADAMMSLSPASDITVYR